MYYNYLSCTVTQEEGRGRKEGFHSAVKSQPSGPTAIGREGKEGKGKAVYSPPLHESNKREGKEKEKAAFTC